MASLGAPGSASVTAMVVPALPENFTPVEVVPVTVPVTRS